VVVKEGLHGRSASFEEQGIRPGVAAKQNGIYFHPFRLHCDKGCIAERSGDKNDIRVEAPDLLQLGLKIDCHFQIDEFLCFVTKRRQVKTGDKALSQVQAVGPAHFVQYGNPAGLKFFLGKTGELGSGNLV